MPVMLRTAAALLPILIASALFAQPPAVPAPTAEPMPSIAAKVNGQPISEVLVEQALQDFPPDERAKYRPEIIEGLISIALVDQYLTALKITVEQKDVDEHLNRFKEELKKYEQDYVLLLKRKKLTETDLKSQIYNHLRWDKFVDQQATDDKLKALFNHMPEAFDGTAIHARHILLAPGSDAKAQQDAIAQLNALKAQIEKDTAAEFAKLPADTDNLTREKKRHELVERMFANAASQHSTCVSKNNGGDLRWFPRYGKMNEPFSQAAYALKPFEVSEIVKTPAGYHLILVVDRKPGMPTNFDDKIVKEAVKEVYEAKLRDAVINQMKPRAKVEIMPVK